MAQEPLHHQAVHEDQAAGPPIVPARCSAGDDDGPVPGCGCESGQVTGIAGKNPVAGRGQEHDGGVDRVGGARFGESGTLQNERALAVYTAAGYRPDGSDRVLDFRGTHVRELRLVEPL
jgi:hypothetical protein